MSHREVYFIGVDVGTGSARAALVSASGRILRSSVAPIRTWNPAPGFYQQSSADIWRAVSTVVQEARGEISKKNIKGVGFDATCSLVAVDESGGPVSLSPLGEKEQNVILWMDHRAKDEADHINSFSHSLLGNCGGKISLEMELPKLLWIKKHLRHEAWAQTHKFFDLPDFLTWRATGSESRSLCSLVCKWLFEASPDGKKEWNSEFMKQIGLGDLLENNSSKIGELVLEPGEMVKGGISMEASEQLGLLPGTPVGTSIIDAHAGGIGLLASQLTPQIPLTSLLCLICGTSTCHMATSKEALKVPGVWGPYWSAMLPGMWLNEAGQSATGSLIDHIINSHPAIREIQLKPGEQIYDFLNKLLCEMASSQGVPVDLLARDIHVWPDYHGNRSPIADPDLKGMISGLVLEKSMENLALVYLAVMQALAYGTKQISERLIESGHEEFKAILICGGLSKNHLMVKTQANVSNIPMFIPNERESVLLGSAILGATASKYYPGLVSAISNMSGPVQPVSPDSLTLSYHEAKYRVFLKMLQDQLSYRNIMNEIVE